MSLIIFFLFLLCPLFIFLIQKWCKNIAKQIPPGPRGLPIIGNLHQINNSQPLFQQLWLFSKKYGPIFSLRLGLRPAIVISSAEIAKEVLKSHDKAFSGRPNLVGLRKLSYNFKEVGFSPYSKDASSLKKICITQLFSPKRVLLFQPLRKEEVLAMIEKIDDLASDARIVNLSEMVICLSNRIVCRNAFGKTYSEESLVKGVFYDLLSEAQKAAGSFYLSDYFPFAGWVDKMTGRTGELEKVFKQFDEFFEKVILEHLDDKRERKGQEDLVDVLLQIQRDGSSSIKLSMDHIKALLTVDIFIAGTDTVASSVLWAMTELIKHPKALHKLQNEIRDLNKNKNFVKEDDAQNIPYLQAAVKETLRLHPPAPLLIPHEATEKCEISGYEIRPKTLVYINAWAIGRDPKYWENPEKFKPERFLGSSVDFRGNHFELIPFGSGRRSCPGIYMGVVTVELILANIIYSFDWEIPYEGDIDMDVKPGVTVHKKNPLCLLARKYLGRDKL